MATFSFPDKFYCILQIKGIANLFAGNGGGGFIQFTWKKPAQSAPPPLSGD
jgi:hypothetical protein